MTAVAVSAVASAPLVPRRVDGLGRGLVFALIAHVLLLAALSANIGWHNQEVVTAEAELWSATPQIAAPRAVEPTPPPVVVAPTPTPPAPPPPDTAQLQRDADIALERQRDKDRLDKARREQADLEQRQRAQELKAEREREAKQQQQRLAAQEAERKRLEALAKAPPKPAPKPPPPAQDNAQREANLKRMLGQAGATGDAGATGTAAKSAGFSASYAGRIAGRIKPNVVFPDALQGNPAVVVELRMSSDGRIVSRRVMQPSGVREWDDAVLRAIDKTDVLPADEQGRVPPIITLVYHPKDLGG